MTNRRFFIRNAVNYVFRGAVMSSHRFVEKWYFSKKFEERRQLLELTKLQVRWLSVGWTPRTVNWSENQTLRKLKKDSRKQSILRHEQDHWKLEHLTKTKKIHKPQSNHTQEAHSLYSEELRIYGNSTKTKWAKPIGRRKLALLLKRICRTFLKS